MSYGDKDMIVQIAKMQEQMTSMAQSLSELKMSIKDILSEHDRALSSTRSDLRLVDKKVDAWIHKAQGSWFAAVLVGPIAQLIIVAAVGWGFAQILDLRKTVHELSASVDFLNERFPLHK